MEATILLPRDAPDVGGGIIGKNVLVKVGLHCDTPVVGVEINPYVKIIPPQDLPLQFTFTWYRSCSSPDLSSSSLLDKNKLAVEQEDENWVKVGSSDTYIPSTDDDGFHLKLEFAVANCLTGTLSVAILKTNPVIPFPTRCPRSMISIRNSLKTNQQESDWKKPELTFNVLSYNILADMCVQRHTTASGCPTWALIWEYRRKNLLEEIIGYKADIICLQEVQSDHFESFFKPKLTKLGYSVEYKEKNDQLYTGKRNVAHGCATFYHQEYFKEIIKDEIEFDEVASSLASSLKPEQIDGAKIRLMKHNIALVLLLEVLKTGSSSPARICVANTHICANPNLPDVRLYQLADLVQRLEKISECKVPVLICGDLNSTPKRIDSSCLENEKDQFHIHRLLKLQHSLPLVSAYESFCTADTETVEQKCWMDVQHKEPLFTHASGDTLDYILYTVGNLKVEGLLELPKPEVEGVRRVLPSPQWSSDHIALMAHFRLWRPLTWKMSPCPQQHLDSMHTSP